VARESVLLFSGIYIIFKPQVTSIVQLFPPVREAPMVLKSLKRRRSRQTDILEAPFFAILTIMCITIREPTAKVN